jgi:ribonuclease-3
MNEREIAIEALQDHLGYRFVETSRLDEALTHASLSQGSKRIANNERLEFLGDRLLNLLVAEHLMKSRPDDSEGDLSKRLHVLVSRDACAAVGRAIRLGPALRLPGGETRGGRGIRTRCWPTPWRRSWRRSISTPGLIACVRCF